MITLIKLVTLITSQIYRFSCMWWEHLSKCSLVVVLVVQSLSCVLLCDAWLSCPSPSPGACSNSCPLSPWCHPTISSSVVLFFFCLQSFTASGSFLVNWLYTSGGQSTGASATESALPMNIQDWSPLGWTGWISLQSKGLSKVFSSTTVQKHQCFGAQPSLWSNSHMYTWPLQNHNLIIWTFVSKIMSAL